jgi:predicted nucleic acid-binding Zn ribbon protein
MLRPMSGDDRDVQCPECESKEVERLLSTFATSGQGSGSDSGSRGSGCGSGGSRGFS